MISNDAGTVLHPVTRIAIAISIFSISPMGPAMRAVPQGAMPLVGSRSR